MQKDLIRITSPKAARVLRHTALLHHFLEPTSPSDVAKVTGLAANLVHHHVKKAFELGILLEHKREHGKVFYQLAAKEFSHSRDLLPIEHKEAEDLQLITAAFLEAYERSEVLLHSNDPDYVRIGFGDRHPNSAPIPKSKLKHSLEQHPAHLHLHTPRLSQKRYAKLMRDMSDLIDAATSESSSEAGFCTVVVLGFAGSCFGSDASKTLLSSFVPSAATPKKQS